MPKMPSITIKIKHDRNVHQVSVDPSQPATAFKAAIHQKTGVPPERQKVMVKGGLLKDDTDLSKLNLKEGQMLMVIGTAGELPKGPLGPINFLEDMTDSQLASATKQKVGLVNLGNTCYLNSTLQVLRVIPELQVALNSFAGNMGGADGERNLTASLRDLYKSLNETTEAFPPLAFLSILRSVAPQFAEQQQQGGGFAQQDAEEAWVRIIQALQSSLSGLAATGDASAAQEAQSRRFIEQYMTGSMLVKRSCPEAPQEEPTYTSDSFKVLQCNISSSTNDMSSGIKDSLTQQLEKTSETLGRTAVYDEQRSIDRLPAYLTTHFVRFYWRREIGKKTKIMRKVRFPFELDVTDFLSEGLKEKTLKYREKVHEVGKEREERAKVRRKAKARREEATKSDAAASTQPDELGNVTSAGAEAPKPADAMAVDTTEEKVKTDDSTAFATASGASTAVAGSSSAAIGAAGAVVSPEEELVLREKESAELDACLHPDLKADVGCNPSALYELVGIVTHKGANADGGHYISWVVKEDDSGADPAAAAIEGADGGKGKAAKLVDQPFGEEWYKFDDEKVSVVGRDKITMLDGGGEDSTAYLLLYRAKRL
ncbi:cysteine proteinase [Jaminaea rosea]|uniref:Ubiquitin carboxyl-terminal hydrolase n=1 Tax=Jaminaea rosea TaxID=1569628 RepID=A0A316UPR4_9BASI|nr:cysteine proteinase [Jaminaea rosea]PWN26331.1 cysteine proteinase [Jaminaea rosea]